MSKDQGGDPDLPTGKQPDHFIVKLNSQPLPGLSFDSQILNYIL